MSNIDLQGVKGDSIALDDSIQYESQDGIARVTLNRPSRLNGLTPSLLSSLLMALQRAGADSSIRVVVLSGNGRAFSAGAELGDWTAEGGVDLGSIIHSQYNPVIKALQSLPVPVLCAVNGVAAGAAANIALACDIVVATRSAAFVQAFARIGLMPDASGTYFLPRLSGTARALGMAMLAEPVPAERAEQWGLIWRCVDDAEFKAQVDSLAHRLAALPSQALCHARRAIRASEHNNLAEQLDLEAQLQRELGYGPDFVEGVNAFLQKRRPTFSPRSDTAMSASSG